MHSGLVSEELTMNKSNKYNFNFYLNHIILLLFLKLHKDIKQNIMQNSTIIYSPFVDNF